MQATARKTADKVEAHLPAGERSEWARSARTFRVRGLPLCGRFPFEAATLRGESSEKKL
jgi:hypothetical protein